MSGREVPDVPADGLLLTPWRDDDTAAVLELADDDVTRAWSPSLRTVRTSSDALAWIHSRRGGDRVDWAVRDLGSGLLVGRTGLHRFDPDGHSAEIGYGVHPAHRRRGVARRSVTAATTYGFTALHLDRISLIHAIGNLASCAVATTTGFAFEGVERSALDHGDGVLHDVHRHARLAGDPSGPAAAPPRPLEPVSFDAGHLMLRPWQPGDADDVLRGLSDPLVVRWNPRLPLRDLAAAATWIAGRAQRWADGRAASWAVVEDHRVVGSQVVGSVALRDLNNVLDNVDAFAVASYWTMPAARGRGVAGTALARATSYAFDVLGLHRVQLAHAVANTASCRVAEKAGFRLEGTLRESNRLADGFSDEHWHARLALDE